MNKMNLAEVIKAARPNLSDGSLRTYVQSIKRIAPDNKIDSLAFLQDTDAVMAKINTFGMNVKRSVLTAIMVAMGANGDTGEALRTYVDALNEYSVLVSDELGKNKKSNKQEKNWTKHENLLAIAKRMIKNAPGNQRSLIAALYTYQPPSRLDFYDMQIIGKGDAMVDKQNYLQIINRNKKNFIFNDYKNSATYKTVTIPVNKAMNTVLNKYFKLNPGIKYLLRSEKQSSKPMTRNSLGKQLPQIFEETGKHITLNQIRHIYISENIDIKKTKQQNELAKQMMHSTGTQLTYAKE